MGSKIVPLLKSVQAFQNTDYYMNTEYDEICKR